MDVLAFLGRGDTGLPLPGAGEALADTPCIACGQCTLYCPVGALTPPDDHRHVAKAIEVKGEADKVHVACVAPSVRVALGEEVGGEPGATSTGHMVAALRALGFDYVFDTQFAADLCVMEEGSELLQRLADGGPFPMFTSCCPGWVNLVEQSYPQWTPHLSTARSPQGMMSSVVKRYFAATIGRDPADVVVTSIMPCTAKKDEAARPQLAGGDGVTPDTDIVLTTRELGRLLRLERIHTPSLAPQPFDDPLGESTTAAALFGVTGGVMEAAVRTAHVLVTGEPLPRLQFDAVRGLAGVKTTTVTLGDTTLSLAAINGTGATRRVLDAIAAGDARYDFVEVMACPGGCIGGGGQPKSHDPLVLNKRMQAVYDADEVGVLRMSHENPAVAKLYDTLLGQPLSATSHDLLHTHYTDRSAHHHHHPVAKLLPAEEL